MTELRRFLQYAEDREQAFRLQRDYAGRLVKAGLAPEYLVAAVKRPGSMWRLELVTDSDETPGDEGSDRWYRALLILHFENGRNSESGRS